MPPLSNPRHERFVQALFEGETADAAYVKAGYKQHDGNCIRLRGNERVRVRLSELQTAAAQSSEVTVVSLLAELEDARQKASNLDQLSAAVRAIEAKAKVSGLLVQRVEVGGAGAFEQCDTPEAVAHALLNGWGSPRERFKPVDEDDKKALTALLLQHYAEVEEFIAGVMARPTTAIRVDGPEARRRFGLLGNGR